MKIENQHETYKEIRLYYYITILLLSPKESFGDILKHFGKIIWNHRINTIFMHGGRGGRVGIDPGLGVGHEDTSAADFMGSSVHKPLQPRASQQLQLQAPSYIAGSSLSISLQSRKKL